MVALAHAMDPPADGQLDAAEEPGASLPVGRHDAVGADRRRITGPNGCRLRSADRVGRRTAGASGPAGSEPGAARPAAVLGLPGRPRPAPGAQTCDRRADEDVVDGHALGEGPVGQDQPEVEHVVGDVIDVLRDRPVAAAQEGQRLGGADQAEARPRAGAVLEQAGQVRAGRERPGRAWRGPGGSRSRSSPRPSRRRRAAAWRATTSSGSSSRATIGAWSSKRWTISRSSVGVG